ncbi:histidine kinase, partial [Luteibacter yeojuensis]
MRSLSLRWRLLLLIIGVLAAVLLPLGILSAHRTLEEVDELSDGRLAQAARTLEVLVNRIGVEQLRAQRTARLLVPSRSAHPAELTVQGRTYESEVGFQVFDRDGTLLMATENLSGVPRTDVPDGQFEDVAQGRYTWRVFTLIMEDEHITIRAGERYDSRHEITHALWIEHGLPTLLGLPLLALLVGWAIRRGLGPLDDLAGALSGREPGSRAPVHLARAPEELAPVLAALNDQIFRLESALERERRFS